MLKQLDELNGAKQVRVFRSNLHDHRQVLPDVALEHLLETRDSLLDAELAKVVDKPLCVVQIGVDDASLDVLEVVVVLQGLRSQLLPRVDDRDTEAHPLHQPSLLAKVRDPWLIIVAEHLVSEDSIRDLRRIDQVHLQQPSLQTALLWLVVLERIEEERGRLLDHVLAHKDVDDAFDIDHRSRLVVDELGGKLAGLLGVDTDEVLQELGVVRGVADLLRVEDDLVELPELGKAGDDLVGDGSAEIDG